MLLFYISSQIAEMVGVTNFSLQLAVLFLIHQKVTSTADVSRSPSADTSPLVDDDVMTAVALATKAAQADLGYRGNRAGSESEARLSGVLNMARQLLRLEDEEDTESEDLARILGHGRAEVALPSRPYRRPDIRSVAFGRRLEPEDNHQQESKVIMKAMRYGRK